MSCCQTAFKFNLRRYIKGTFDAKREIWGRSAVYNGLLNLLSNPRCAQATAGEYTPRTIAAIGRAVPADSIKTRLESAYGFSA